MGRSKSTDIHEELQQLSSESFPDDCKDDSPETDIRQVAQLLLTMTPNKSTPYLFDESTIRLRTNTEAPHQVKAG